MQAPLRRLLLYVPDPHTYAHAHMPLASYVSSCLYFPMRRDAGSGSGSGYLHQTVKRTRTQMPYVATHDRGYLRTVDDVWSW